MEAPHLKQLQEKYGERIRVVAVSIREDEPDQPRKFVEENKLPYTVLVNGQETFNGPYKGKSIPQSYIIDATRKIRYAELGFEDDSVEKMTRVIDELLSARQAVTR